MKKKIRGFDFLYYIIALAAFIVLFILFTNALTTYISLKTYDAGAYGLELVLDGSDLDTILERIAVYHGKTLTEDNREEMYLLLIAKYTYVDGNYILTQFYNISIPAVILEGVGIAYILAGMIINFYNMSSTMAIFSCKEMKKPGILSIVTGNIIAGILRLAAKDKDLKPSEEDLETE